MIELLRAQQTAIAIQLTEAYRNSAPEEEIDMLLKYLAYIKSVRDHASMELEKQGLEDKLFSDPKVFVNPIKPLISQFDDNQELLTLHKAHGEKPIGTILKETRSSLALHQTEIAKRLRVSPSMVSLIEDGKRLASPLFASDFLISGLHLESDNPLVTYLRIRTMWEIQQLPAQGIPRRRSVKKPNS